MFSLLRRGKMLLSVADNGHSAKLKAAQANAQAGEASSASPERSFARPMARQGFLDDVTPTCEGAALDVQLVGHADLGAQLQHQ